MRLGALVDGSPKPAAHERQGAGLERLDLEDPRWRAFVAAHEDALPIHDPAWARLLADCYGFDAFALALLGGETADVLAGMPVIAVAGRRRALVSLPFTDYCPPLLGPPLARDELAELLTAMTQSGAIELRCALAAEPALAPVGYRHVLELGPDPASAFARFHHSSVQRAIRKAERERALTLRIAQDEQDMCRTFYRLHLATRRRHGAPIQPRRFFRLLWQRMIEPGHGTLVLASAGSQPVAGAVFLRSRGALLYKYGASDPAAWSLRPNHLIFWDAIQRACLDGARSLDFGRSDLGDDGLRRFKSSWGAAEEPLVYTRFTPSGIAPAPAAGSGGLLAAAIRRAPAVVCRVTGELLYRYAA